VSGSSSPAQAIVAAAQIATVEAHRRAVHNWGACVEGVSKWVTSASFLRGEETMCLL